MQKVMITKAIKFLLSTAGVCGLITACEPLEDSSWVNNSHVFIDWKNANPETGMRPIELDSLEVFYYSQSDNLPDFRYPMDKNVGEFEVRTNCYDVVVTHPSPYYHRDEKFRSMTIKLPTRVNHKAETIISESPSEMIYAGIMAGVMVDWDVRRNIYINMTRLLKKINFVVTITDVDELLMPVTVDLSGLASQKKIWDGVCDKETEAIQVFDLNKHGRYLNTEKYITAYKGYTLCLGAVGRNILYLTYYDAAGKKKVGKYDLTSYFTNWSTEEVTVRINIDATDDSVTLEGWEMGDTTDYIFNFGETN